MINGDPLWHVSAIKLWANWSSFNKINGHMVPSILLALLWKHLKKVRIITLKEPSHCDSSFEYPHHMFWFRNETINYMVRTHN